jgi:divalent metal cation (Fe/Co/Zn/Cd) transporter
VQVGAARRRLLVIAFWLSVVTVVWGSVSGGVSVVAGVLDGSLGVIGLGLNVMADVIGSAVMTWRFRGELRHSFHGERLEHRAARVIAVALAIVSTVLAVSATLALAAGSHPGHSTVALVIAVLSVLVFTPLAYAKLRVAPRLGSRALRGDGALSAIGAGIALLALTGLWLVDAFGWWWADRVAALVVAAIAAAESARAARE